MPMREKRYVEQMGLFVAAHRSRPPSWKAIPAEERIFDVCPAL